MAPCDLIGSVSVSYRPLSLSCPLSVSIETETGREHDGKTGKTHTANERGREMRTGNETKSKEVKKEETEREGGKGAKSLTKMTGKTHTADEWETIRQQEQRRG